MIMGLGSLCYKKDAKLFNDSDETVRIRWYKAPAGAKPFPYFHRVQQHAWHHIPEMLQGIGEVYGAPIQIDRGDPPPCADGQNFYGDPEKFLWGTTGDPSKPPTIRDHFYTVLDCGGGCDPIWFRGGYGSVIIVAATTIILKEVDGTPTLTVSTIALAQQTGIACISSGGGTGLVFLVPATPTQMGVVSTEGQEFAGDKVWHGYQFVRTPLGGQTQYDSDDPSGAVTQVGNMGPPTGFGSIGPSAVGMYAFGLLRALGLVLDTYNNALFLDNNDGPMAIWIRKAFGVWAQGATGTRSDGLQTVSGLVTALGTAGGGGMPPDGTYGEINVAGSVWTVVTSVLSAFGRLLAAAADAAAARGHLGLGDAALADSDDFEPAGAVAALQALLGTAAYESADSFALASQLADLIADLGTAAYEDAASFDPAGTAEAEVNGLEALLGTAAYQNTSAFDPAGTASTLVAALQALLGTAAYESATAFQPSDSVLNTLSTLTLLANKVFGTNGSGDAELLDSTTIGRQVLAGADASAIRSLLGIAPFKFAVLQEAQSSGTNGGTFTNGAWRTRPLGEVIDPDGIVTTSAGTFSLGVGTYVLIGVTQAGYVDGHQARIQRTSPTSGTEFLGTSAYQSQAETQYATTHSFLLGYFTAGATSTYELQHKCQTTFATYGMGFASNSGAEEVYSRILIIKVA